MTAHGEKAPKLALDEKPTKNELPCTTPRVTINMSIRKSTSQSLNIAKKSTLNDSPDTTPSVMIIISDNMKSTNRSLDTTPKPETINMENLGPKIEKIEKTNKIDLGSTRSTKVKLVTTTPHNLPKSENNLKKRRVLPGWMKNQNLTETKNQKIFEILKFGSGGNTDRNPSGRQQTFWKEDDPGNKPKEIDDRNNLKKKNLRKIWTVMKNKLDETPQGGKKNLRKKKIEQGKVRKIIEKFEENKCQTSQKKPKYPSLTPSRVKKGGGN